jgi:2-dehydropantoate 2-reductase
VFACLLAESGCHVEAIGRGAHFDAVRSGAVEVDGIWGSHRAELARAHDSGASASGPFDAVLVTCKAFQTDELLREIDPGCLAGAGRAISLQNGLGNIEKIQAVFGSARALGGRVIFGAEIARPGLARVTVEAEPTLIGHATGNDDPGARYWATRFRSSGAPADATTSILAALWGKVFYNAALNPMGALLSLPYGDLPKDPQRRTVMDRVMDEAFAVASAEGIALPWKDSAEYRRHFYERLLPVTSRHRSSMLQDLEKNRPTEIEAISGEICRRGDTHGLDVSANRVLLALVRSRSGASRRLTAESTE